MIRRVENMVVGALGFCVFGWRVHVHVVMSGGVGELVYRMVAS